MDDGKALSEYIISVRAIISDSIRIVGLFADDVESDSRPIISCPQDLHEGGAQRSEV